MRWPLTNVPLRDRPSSETVHSLAEALELGVQARDLGVPRQRDARCRRCGRSLTRSQSRLEDEQALLAVAVAQDEERRPSRSASMRSRSSAGVALWA